MITIYIKDLIVGAKHGWHPHEKQREQRFKISVEMETETRANQTDQLEDTFNWSQMRDQIVAVTKNNSFNLVEKLAQAIADELLKERRIQKVKVVIDKLDAFDNGVPGVRLQARRQ
jgi:dihydroneopterin aldolase